MGAMNTRDLPIIHVIGPFPDRTFTCLLPGSLRVAAKTREAAEAIVKRHAPYSAIQFSKPMNGWDPAEQ
jgi:uncharacterized protein YciI